MSPVLLHAGSEPSVWWKDAVIYQIYPRSFASSSGKIGDLRGITSRLDHVRDLGVDAVWLSPFYLSPQHDAGYDVADYRRVDPMFGTNDDAIALFDRAHDLGLKVIIDLVPNHTSHDHEWFKAALEGGPDAPERDLYIFRDGKGVDGSEPPNNWISVFGGIAWTRVCDRPDAVGSAWENDKQWYLHLFDTSQPDLNWNNPKVHEEVRDILRFWLDRGADGFRVDVAHGLVKDAGLPDWDFHWDMVSGGSDVPNDVTPPPMWNRPGVHDIYREWREVLDEYGPERMLVAEAWVDDINDLAKYVRPDEMSQSFNFEFLTAEFAPDSYRKVIAESLAAMDSVGAPTTWVLSNHDVVRATSRLGLSKTGKGPNGIRPFEEQPEVELGRRRALAAHLLQSALPGSCYIYQGEELSLPEHMAVPDELREDPAFLRTNKEEAGRDGCRVPLPWEADKPGFGFSPTAETWLPQPSEWAKLAPDVQSTDAESSLNHFKRMFELRKKLELGRARLLDVSDEAGVSGNIHYISQIEGRDDVHIVMAFNDPVVLPRDARVLLASDEIVDGVLAPNTTVWFQMS